MTEKMYTFGYYGYKISKKNPFIIEFAGGSTQKLYLNQSFLSRSIVQ